MTLFVSDELETVKLIKDPPCSPPYWFYGCSSVAWFSLVLFNYSSKMIGKKYFGLLIIISCGADVF